MRFLKYHMHREQLRPNSMLVNIILDCNTVYTEPCFLGEITLTYRNIVSRKIWPSSSTRLQMGLFFLVFSVFLCRVKLTILMNILPFCVLNFF